MPAEFAMPAMPAMSAVLSIVIRSSLLATLAGCAALAPPLSSFVVMTGDGVSVARVLTAGAACPPIRLDGRDVAMSMRAPAATIAQRPTVSPALETKPSAFPVRACEARIPAGSVQASVAGRPLPLPRARLARIVVIDDTGCRLKTSGAYQDCNRTLAYPFARVAALAAAWKPDLVVHVGDYHYRENACLAERPGCAGSPWGYGWDAWDADFFTPASALLKAAPWVMARGNHESCTRAGQGFLRFLDPRSLRPGRCLCSTATRDCRMRSAPSTRA